MNQMRNPAAENMREERHELHRYLVISFAITILLFILPEALFGGTWLYAEMNPDFDMWGMIPVNDAFMLFFLLIFLKPLALLGLQHLCAFVRDIPVRPRAWRITRQIFWLIMIADVATICFLFHIANTWAE